MNNPSSSRSDAIERAAIELVARRHNKLAGDSLAADIRPHDVDEAQAIQQRVLTLLGVSGGGWKCSLPAPGKAAVLAPIQAPRITQAPIVECTSPASDGTAEIEPEVAYIIGTDLPPRATPYSEQEVLQAVASTHIVFELIGSRYIDRSTQDFPSQLADSLANYGLFVGPQIDPAHHAGTTLESFALTLHDVQQANAEIGSWTGKHPDGHPLRPLHWLANYLATTGKGLQRGEVVTTGSYHGVIRVPVNKALSMHFGPLGKLDVTIRPAT